MKKTQNKTLINCPLCHEESFYKFSISKFNKPFEIYKCKKCHVLFQYPFLTEKEIENLYTKDYYEGNTDYVYEDERKKLKYYDKVWKKRVFKIKQFIQFDKIKELKFFLDMGCSFGGLLKIASLNGFIPYGVDISEYARNYAKSWLQTDFIYKNIKEIQENNFFNAITLIEVIEHLQNPLETLKRCYHLLKEKGVLVIQTANFDSLQAVFKGKSYNYFLPGHLFYFSRKNLKYFLKQIGFSKIKVFQPVEFGLTAKLLKSKGDFKSFKDYTKWIKITFYHFISKLLRTDFISATGSLVIYAKK